MIKKLAIVVAILGGFALLDAPKAEAWPYRRVAPVRRIVAPPYPVARAVVAPRYVAPRYYGRPYYGGPYVTGYRGFYSPGIYIGF